MDAMALLCTLHADGPTTLKRLRQAGCDSIEAVGALDPDRLAKLLDTTPAAARRFLREAAHLSTRLDAGFLEREEKSVEVRSTEAATDRDPFPSGAPSGVPGGTPSGTALRELHPTLGYRDQRIVEQVLQAWRKQDSQEDGRADPRTGEPSHSAPPPAEHSAHSAAARAAHEPGSADDGSAEAARAVHPRDAEARDDACANPAAPAIPESSATDLFPGAVDGLDQETCLRLRRAGIHDVAMLSRIDPLALSKTLGVGYMRLVRLCALARRRLANHPVAVSAHSSVRGHPTSKSGATTDAPSEPSSETKFSRAGNPPIGVLPALAQDLEQQREIGVGPKPLLPSRTMWSPRPAATSEGEDAGGPFA